MNMVEFLKKNLITILIAAAVILVAGSFIFLDLGKDLNKEGAALTNPPAGQNSQSEVQVASVADFARCLTQKGVKFYGADWCSHCANQKKLFGDAMQYVTYVECWDDANNTLNQACIDAKIEAFPTWDFPNGTRQLGELSFEKLGELSGCKLEK